ncbi:MAG: class I SAM-dependent RNA methyltransferase [Smithellaceae bacterium]
MSIWKEKNRILVTCPKGANPYLHAEIENLGYRVLNEIDTAVTTEGTLEDAMLLNLNLRTAQRVLYQLQMFKVISPGALYERVASMPWENLLYDSGHRAYVCVTSVAENPLITDSRFVNLRVKDAIVDRIREKTGVRPDSGPAKDRAVVHVYWKNDQANVYIDTSGERLSMRGYRKIPLAAPMQEVLAASLIFATGWRGRGAFINPMCGSGTLAIEAALMAQNRAPGLLRSNFAFMYIKDFPQELWQNMRKEARQRSFKKPSTKIIATDMDEKAVQAARQNAQTAGVDHLIDFSACGFEQTTIPPGGGVIMMNPPYGERMEGLHTPALPVRRSRQDASGKKAILRKAADRPQPGSTADKFQRLEALYAGTGDFFKQVAGGYRGYIFTGNLDMMKKIGLRTKRRLTFYNGEIECRLLEYELYSGSKKKMDLLPDAIVEKKEEAP